MLDEAMNLTHSEVFNMVKCTTIRSVELSLDELCKYISDSVYLTIRDKLHRAPEKCAVTFNENLRCVVFSAFSEDD